MATTATTSPNTNDVVNWAYKYSVACMKLVNAENTASSSSTRRQDIAAAQATFNATMKSLVPSSVQSSAQFQYFDALTSYNTDMAAASTEKERQAAMTKLATALNVSIPSATSTTLSSLLTDTLKLQRTNLSNAATGIKSLLSNAGVMASNASSAWLTKVASGASILNSLASNATQRILSELESLGFDTSGITTPTVTLSPSSAFAAGSASATTGGLSGSIMNAALVGYLVAEQAAETNTS